MFLDTYTVMKFKKWEIISCPQNYTVLSNKKLVGATYLHTPIYIGIGFLIAYLPFIFLMFSFWLQ